MLHNRNKGEIRLKKKILVALFISMLFFVATVSEVSAVTGWTSTYSSWSTPSEPWKYGVYLTDATNDNHIKINASLAVSVYEYRIDPVTGKPYVDFRLAFTFQSDADSPYQVYIDYMDFQIEKDSSGVGLDKQAVGVLTSNLVSYSHGKGLFTPTGRTADNSLSSRYDLAFKTLKFAIGLVGWPETQAIALSWSLLQLATSYFPLQVTDYDEAGWSSSDRWASCYWFGPGSGSSGHQDSDAFDTLRWWQTAGYNPSTYMRLKIRCVFQLV